jgi:glycerol kinase
MLVPIGREIATYSAAVDQGTTGTRFMVFSHLKIISDAAETERIAQEVEESGDAYFVPAFSGLFAPRWEEK